MIRALFLTGTLFALAACAAGGVVPQRVLAPAGLARGFAWGQAEAGGVDLTVSGDHFPGDALLLPMRMSFDVDDRLRPWLDWQPLAWVDGPDANMERRGSGDLAFGVQQRLTNGGEGGLSPLVSVNVFGVTPHGGPRPPRLPGIIEGEEGYYALLMSEWGDLERSLTLNVGAGVGGRVGSRIPGQRFETAGQDGKSGRVLASLAFTEALPSTGVDFATEPSRLGAELFWLHDPVDDRTFAELHVGFSFWLGANEVDLGWRRGLTSETEDDVFYLGFRVRLFDTLSF